MPHKTRKLLLDISLACNEILDFIDEAAMWDFAVNRVPELLEKVENY